MATGYFIVDRVTFDDAGNGRRSLEGVVTEGGHFGTHRSEKAALADAEARVDREPEAVFGVFELVAFVEKKASR